MFCGGFLFGLVFLFCSSCLLVFVVLAFFLVEAKVLFLSCFNRASNTFWLKYFSEVAFVLTKSDSQTRYGHIEMVRRMRKGKKKTDFKKDQVKSISSTQFLFRI